MWNAGLDEAQGGVKIARRIINNLRYADGITLMAGSKEELKSLFMKQKEDSEKAGLKLNIQKTKIMGSGPITSWQIGGETMETVTHFILRGSKITGDGDCSHEMKRCTLLGRKAMINLDSILESRDITLPTKAHLVIAMVFPIVMYGNWSIELGHKENWMPKNWWFWTALLEKTLESLLDCKEIQQGNLKGNHSWIFIRRTVSLVAQMVKRLSAMQETWVGLIPGLRRSSGEGNGSPLQYSCLENPMDRGAW